ncbi:hypothetical protein [uncultured Flavonifractor sp.]|uniref:hypothetical protein n=1 Tax=uncultured Flavonifractor sp. TaxID=1193534 RepID=UPI002603F4B0|nr:hypothetical protein [uncultured Flavonifractor sp.]
MCCCNRQNRCCRRGCCSGTGNGGAVTLSALEELSRMAGGGTAGTGWPVYVSVPAFLWEGEEEESDSCGSCRPCCCRPCCG